jgi:hypothetical protein
MKIRVIILCKKNISGGETASDIDMNVNEFIVHAYPIQNEEFLLRFSHLTNYLDRYVASVRQSRLVNIKSIPKENFYLPLSSRCNFFLIFDIFPTLSLPPSDPSVAPDTSVIISLVELRQRCSST